jgi:peptidoglycan/LPS O-acetylase OafA/YrhL
MKMAHHPGLDGVRASALIMIMLFHADPSWIPGGFISVSLFFTLSGYLITSILLFEGESNGNVSLKTFWSRRLRRLVPASMVTIATVVGLSTWLSSGIEQGRIRGDALAATTYVANWRSIFSEHSYSELFTDHSPLQHLWSLSIEEQLYVVVPVVVFISFMLRLKRQGIGYVFLGLSALSVAIAIVVDGHDRIYYGTDTRAVELFVGAVLACFLSPKLEKWAHLKVRWWSFLFLAPLIAFIWFSLIIDGQSKWLYTGWLGVFALLNVFFVVGSMIPGPMRWLMSLPPLTLLGRMSYGIYLIHWPVYVWLNESQLKISGFWLLLVRWAVVFALAGILYQVIEKPIRAKSFLRTNRSALIGLVCSFSVVMVLPLLFLKNPSQRISTEVEILSTVSTSEVVSTLTPSTATSLVPEVTTTVGPPLVDRSLPINVLVIGDSSAENIAKALDVGSDGNLGVISAGVLGCPLVNVDLVYRRVDENQSTDYCPDNQEIVRTYVNQIDAVLLVGSVANQWAYELIEGGPKVEVGTTQWVQNLDEFLWSIGEVIAERGLQVLVLESPIVRDDAKMNGDTPSDIQAWNEVMNEWEKKYQWVSVVPYADLLAPADSDLGRVQRPDGTHLDEVFGETMAREKLIPRLRDKYFDALDEMNQTRCRSVVDMTLDLDLCRVSQ